MLPIRWRKGLGQASTRERWLLLGGQELAERLGWFEEYEDRCDSVGSILCDSHDLTIRSVGIKWGRHKGYLLCIYTVHYGHRNGVRSYRWRISVSPSAAAKTVVRHA